MLNTQLSPSFNLKFSGMVGTVQRYSVTNDDIDMLGKKTQLPTKNRNYCIFNEELVDKLVEHAESSTPLILKKLQNTKDEKTITESLYTFDKMIEAKKFDINQAYPTLSKLNNTKSPNVQVFLSGIYRKTQPPDAFGPLCSMLIQNSKFPPMVYFDPNEEIGGAILDYIRKPLSKEVSTKTTEYISQLNSAQAQKSYKYTKSS